jgi:hypothetical protein
MLVAFWNWELEFIYFRNQMDSYKHETTYLQVNISQMITVVTCYKLF